MKRLLIVWHSRTGTAEAMARAARDGAAEEPGCAVTCLPAGDAAPEDLLAADGYLFAAPENLGALSGEMKALFDRCYYPLLGQAEGRPYGLMVAAGSDGQGAARQAARICTGWRLRQVQAPLIVNMQATSPEEILARKQPGAMMLAPCRELGQAMAAALAAGIW